MSIFTTKKANTYWRGPAKSFSTPKCFKKNWRKFCERNMNRHASTHESLFNPELREKFIRVAPAGGSIKTLAHYSKLSRSGQFKPLTYYDGVDIVEYVGDEAPLYELNKVSVPTLLFVGRGDDIISEKCLSYLMGNLTGIPKERLLLKFVENDHFMHMDFSLGKNLTNLVFIHVLNYLKSGEL